jgi:hypothetical protein
MAATRFGADILGIEHSIGPKNSRGFHTASDARSATLAVWLAGVAAIRELSSRQAIA